LEVILSYPAKPWQCPDPLHWGAYLLRPEMQLYAPNHPAPTACAIYGLFSADGRVLYIGRTVQLQARIRQHLFASLRGLRGKFDRYGFRLAPEHMLRDFEIAHIQALYPEQNYSCENPEWEPHDEMVAALRCIWRERAQPARAKKPVPYWRLNCGLSMS
jgi:hypothetical protein